VTHVHLLGVVVATRQQQSTTTKHYCSSAFIIADLQAVSGGPDLLHGRTEAQLLVARRCRRPAAEQSSGPLAMFAAHHD